MMMGEEKSPEIISREFLKWDEKNSVTPLKRRAVPFNLVYNGYFTAVTSFSLQFQFFTTITIDGSFGD
jgi:hypothetical protein